MSYLELLKQELAKSGATGSSVPFVAPIPVISKNIHPALDQSNVAGISYLDRLKQEIEMQMRKSVATEISKDASVPFVAPIPCASQNILSAEPVTDLQASTHETTPQVSPNKPRLPFDQRKNPTLPKALGI